MRKKNHRGLIALFILACMLVQLSVPALAEGDSGNQQTTKVSLPGEYEG